MAWKWTKQREQAAKLAAEDTLTNDQIAATIGITRQGIDRWRAAPEFQARVASIVAAYADAIKDEGIANVKNRVAALNRDFDATETIIAERAAAPEVQAAPGGKTGRIVRTQKMLGSGEFGREIEEFAYDGALIQSRMALLKQAAQDLGQWTERKELTGKDGAPLVTVYLPDNGRD